MSDYISRARNGKLDLFGKGIGDSDVIELAVALKTNNAIKELFLQTNYIGDSGVIELAVALKTNNAITKLDLRDNNIGDSGVIELAGALKFNNTIMTLWLNYNKIGDSGVIELAVALKSNNAITELSLIENPANEELREAVEQLAKADRRDGKAFADFVTEFSGRFPALLEQDTDAAEKAAAEEAAMGELFLPN